MSTDTKYFKYLFRSRTYYNKVVDGIHVSYIYISAYDAYAEVFDGEEIKGLLPGEEYITKAEWDEAVAQLVKRLQQ